MKIILLTLILSSCSFQDKPPIHASANCDDGIAIDVHRRLKDCVSTCKSVNHGVEIFEYRKGRKYECWCDD